MALFLGICNGSDLSFHAAWNSGLSCRQGMVALKIAQGKKAMDVECSVFFAFQAGLIWVRKLSKQCTPSWQALPRISTALQLNLL